MINKKKYKLICEYPNSGKLGTISWIEDNGSVVLSNSGNILPYSNWPINYILYPEFWEEIVEREYEIVSYKSNEFNNWSVNSIKRLSDGEIFTVGDKITGTKSVVELSKYGNKYVTIESFKFEKYLRIYITSYYIEINGEQTTFGNMKKYIVKQPLFKTEDGLDIFEGDDIYWINSNTLKLYEAKVSKNMTNASIFKNFLTKEKAEEYIVMNKPCLSIVDLQKIFGESSFDNTMKIINLKELVKSKL